MIQEKLEHFKPFIVEVIYATPILQVVLKIKIATPTTYYDAIKNCCMQRWFNHVDFNQVQIGCYGKIINDPKHQIINKGDRIEIYRPLITHFTHFRKKPTG